MTITVGAVLIGALIGGMFTSIILSALGVTAQTWMLLVGAAVVAIIAVAFLKQFIIIGSSFQGSYLVVAGAYALITGMSLACRYPVFSVGAACKNESHSANNANSSPR